MDSVASASRPSKSRVNKANRKTYAARWNMKILSGLQAALTKDPEADLAALLPSTYSEQLRSCKRPAVQLAGIKPRPLFPDSDIRSRLCITDPSTIICELSTEVGGLLRIAGSLSEAIISLLDESEVLYKCAWAASVMVFKVSETIVLKVTDEGFATTEYHSLSFLQQHLPAFPAPRPHGLVRIRKYGLLFTTFIPGQNLEQAWPQLDNAQKRSISSQLDTLFSDLRRLPFPANTPLGGVQGDGCKDGRRGQRTSSQPIMDIKQFEDFIFAGSATASPLYTRLLRDMMPTTPAKCVFTHGDIRPANIMVEKAEDGIWKIIAIIDWEASGFYPEYWECVKMTNNLTARDNDDWYMYLPESFSPRQYSVQWLVDRVWDRSLVHS
ncbi:kinase-like domain-containing protein [Durotheca rogersii]|uniref:kinase-like domain-containing protein n=1 Tax=Durotheca rogersii TaxID=419775 RepID=UPI002220625A|nr:kinase-like domain-containing protein [Durotheca rogersii]KAI5865516.1 kinase-like domain-containing protein [Durotheca rogersii]